MGAKTLAGRPGLKREYPAQETDENLAQSAFSQRFLTAQFYGARRFQGIGNGQVKTE